MEFSDTNDLQQKHDTNSNLEQVCVLRTILVILLKSCTIFGKTSDFFLISCTLKNLTLANNLFYENSVCQQKMQLKTLWLETPARTDFKIQKKAETLFEENDFLFYFFTFIFFLKDQSFFKSFQNSQKKFMF